MTDEVQHLLQVLTGLRKSSGDSQTDLSDAFGIRQPTVSSWERGRHAPPLWQFVEWAQRYGCRVEVVPDAGDHRAGQLRELLSIAAGLDQAQFDDLLAFARVAPLVPDDVRGGAVVLVESVSKVVRAKSA